MSITVKDLLNMDGFSEFRVLSGGNGLEGKVESVSVMDAPDIYKWLQGGEVLLTSGYVLQDRLDTMPELIQKISDSKAVALFIKLGRFVDELPREVLNLSDKLDFPIIFMPFSFAFVDVITPVLTRVNTERLELIKKSERINCVFTNIAVDQEGIDKVIEYLSNLLGFETAFVSNDPKKYYPAEKGELLEHQNYMSIYPCFPVNANRKSYGYVVVLNPDFKAKEYDLIAIEHASTIIKLEIQRQISNDEIERKYRDNFVLDIIYHNTNNREEMEERGRLFGWSLNQPYRVMIADVDHFRENYEKSKFQKENTDDLSRKLLKQVTGYVQQGFPGCIYTTFTDRVVFLLKEQGESHKQIKQRLQLIEDKFEKNMGFTLTFALGGLTEDGMDVHKSYEQARTTLELCRKLMKECCVLFYSQLGFYQLLDQLRGNPYVENFSQNRISRLIEYDKEHNTELHRTLELIIENDWNLHDTADGMFIHYNTIKNRYRKIQEVLHMKLDTTEHKLELEFAIMSRNIFETKV